jgi:hypothetical protein
MKRRDGWTAFLEKRFEDICWIGGESQNGETLFRRRFAVWLLLLQLLFPRIQKIPRSFFIRRPSTHPCDLTVGTPYCPEP